MPESLSKTQRSLFGLAKMDCHAEETLIRMKLSGIAGLKRMEFDLSRRQLLVIHAGPVRTITLALEELKLGSRLIETHETSHESAEPEHAQRRLLWAVLLINLSFFIIELLFGLLSNSMGLVADSLDMLADALVYGISLWAVGHSLSRKKMAAHLAGYLQLILALAGFSEIIRRFFGISGMPDPTLMIGVSFFALLANGVCLYLIRKSKSRDEVHIRASMIFTSNDVIVNLGVMVAGAMVMFSGSSLPDLLAGSVVFAIVIRGAFRILALAK